MPMPKHAPRAASCDNWATSGALGSNESIQVEGRIVR